MKRKYRKFKIFVKSFLTRNEIKEYINHKSRFLSQIYFLRCHLNKLFFMQRLLKLKKIHLGCGDVRLPGFVNIDYRATKATDLVHDCSDLDFIPSSSIETVLADAFFEHIYRKERIILLKSIRRVLNSQGKAIILGIPDFKRVAQAYLNKERGVFSKTFDLNEVYRYTHGDPEQHPDWWQQQLHKSLFDAEILEELLTISKFHKYAIFRYCYKEEKRPYTLGFIAFKQSQSIILSKRNLLKMLKTLPIKLNLSKLKLIMTR